MMMRMANFRSPQIWMLATPGIVCSRSLNTLFAISLSSFSLRRSLCTVATIMAFEFASCLATIGGSQSGGRLRWARATRSRTSFVAASRSSPRSNSTTIVLRPSADVDVSERIPAIPLMLSSRGSVICDSITSAFAPAYVVVTFTIGGSTFGNWRTPRKVKPTMPTRTIVMLITIDRTGRRIERMDRFTGGRSPAYSFSRRAVLTSPRYHPGSRHAAHAHAYRCGHQGRPAS